MKTFCGSLAIEIIDQVFLLLIWMKKNNFLINSLEKFKKYHIHATHKAFLPQI